jgi:pimeloyl-ACP methyl ester carboxylesterase
MRDRSTTRHAPRQHSAARRWLSTAAKLLAGYLAVCVLFGIVLAEASLRLPRHRYEDAAGFQARVARMFGAQVADVQMKASDGVTLRGWYVQPAQPNGQSVILLHGMAGNRIDPSGLGDIFMRAGYSILLPDSREHGLSGGHIATYGILERDDVRRWVQLVRQRAPGCTYLLGESMGAAIGLQAAAITPQLCAVAVEAPYANFREISYERLGNELHTGAWFWRTLGRPAVEAAFLYTRLRYGVYLPDAAPRRAVEQTRTPTLLIAGTADQMHHAEELAASCPSHCILWIVPGAAHGAASMVEPAAFRTRVLHFFEHHE